MNKPDETNMKKRDETTMRIPDATRDHIRRTYMQENNLYTRTEESKQKPSYHLYEAYQSYCQHNGVNMLFTNNTISSIGALFGAQKGDKATVKAIHLHNLVVIIAEYDMAKDKRSVFSQTKEDLQILRNSIRNHKCERKDLIDAFANCIGALLDKSEDKTEENEDHHQQGQELVAMTHKQ